MIIVSINFYNKYKHNWKKKNKKKVRKLVSIENCNTPFWVKYDGSEYFKYEEVMIKNTVSPYYTDMLVKYVRAKSVSNNSNYYINDLMHKISNPKMLRFF